MDSPFSGRKNGVISKIALFTAAFLASSQGALAQFSVPPGAGGQFQQIPPPPVPQKAVPEIQIEQGRPPAVPGADEVRFVVRSLRVTGQTLYSEADLIAVTGFSPGR